MVETVAIKTTNNFAIKETKNFVIKKTNKFDKTDDSAKKVMDMRNENSKMKS